MRRALVAIGVNRTKSMFPPLRAAARGAAHLHDWAVKQGFDTKLLTDAGGQAVRLADVHDAIAAFVDKGVYDQLVLYFSGHGLLPAPDCEVWLLSGAPNNPSEAINVRESIARARTCGIDHVVVYSDACRSIPQQLQAMLTPGAVFEMGTPRSPVPEVDTFYATLPGSPAYELPPDQASAAHRGLLTECLLEALKGNEPSVVEPLNESVGATRVVAARPLKAYLLRAVPAAAAKVSIKLAQSPDARVESALPKFLAELPNDAPALTTKGVPAKRDEKLLSLHASAPMSMSRTIEQVQERVMVPSRPFSKPANIDAIADPAGVRKAMSNILDAKGRISFETRTGFTVRGVGVASAIVTGTTCDLFEEAGATQVRVQENYEEMAKIRPMVQRTAAIRFSDGAGVVLSVLPGYVGAVLVEDGRVVSVNYTPARGTANYHEYVDVADQLEQRRAFVAVAARNGSLRMEAGKGVADYLRVLKRVDPTLGIYAAYAYAQAGYLEGVRSVFEYMSYEREPLPFDVAMLALQREPGAVLNYAPGMPMLTQGWMSLGRFENIMPPPLQAARRYLKPSLWTTFMPKGMDILEPALSGAHS